MNRNKLKTYAPKARRDFIAAVSARAIKFGVSKDKIEPVQVQGNVALIAGQAHPKKVAEQRAKLEARIKTRGFEQVMEEAAYTWFNRFAAIRYMEVHGYLDHGYRVLSHPEGKPIPEIVEHAQHLDLPGLDMEKVIELKLDGTKEGELYRMLLLAQCNALHAAMPFLFERINDETELLLPDNLLHSDSVIRQLVNEIDEADWQEIEIIGWLYQFYISEKKDQVIGKVVKSEDIPAATQLFTPNWIVKYMVQNTLGAKWLATYPQSGIRAKMEYYIEPAEQTEGVKAQLAEITPKELNPEEITFLDPACGSGHILVEAYDLFKDIYLERGYVLRDVPRLILEKNLFGLDIDDRAAQMAAFALLMKARADDRRVFDRSISMNVMAIQDSKGLDAKEICRVLVPDERFELVPSYDLLPDILPQPTLATHAGGMVAEAIHELVGLFVNGKAFGSLIRIPSKMMTKLNQIQNITQQEIEGDLINKSSVQAAIDVIKPLISQASVLHRRYDCVVANPPYMGGQWFCNDLKEMASKEYTDAKADLFSMFIRRGLEMIESGNFVAMVTMQSWMFLKSFEAIRTSIINATLMRCMLHMGNNVMGIAFGTAATVFIKHRIPSYVGTYSKVDIGDIDKPPSERLMDRRVMMCQDEFTKIPGSPLAYWISGDFLKAFDFPALRDIAKTREGMVTGNNVAYLRYWHEVAFPDIKLNSKDRDDAIRSKARWFPYIKGGEARKWYGNRDFVVDWQDDGSRIRNTVDSKKGKVPGSKFNLNYIFRRCVSWSALNASHFSARYSFGGDLFDSTGPACFPEDEDIYYIIGILNSAPGKALLDIINPTVRFLPGDIGSMPIPKIQSDKKDTVSNLAQAAIAAAKDNWDRYETSFDFSGHPIGFDRNSSIGTSFENCKSIYTASIERIRNIEKDIDNIVSDAYGVPRSEGGRPVYSSPSTDDDIRSLLSYSIGCTMGRYSLDDPGLIYANSGNIGFDSSRYTTFPADDDGIVPIMQTDWFDDDAATRFVEFLKVAWSPETLTENLKFVADALGPKGNETPIDTIRRYLSTEFFKDHLKTYKKRPIYWLFSSGKEKAFEALVYLHRYNESTLSRMRMEYVTPLQGRISSRIDQLGRDIEAAASTAAQNKLRKEQEKLKKQQAELIKFDEELRHRADMRINLDLDDGVKVNYGKFGNLLAEVKAITGGSDE